MHRGTAPALDHQARPTLIKWIRLVLKLLVGQSKDEKAKKNKKEEECEKKWDHKNKNKRFKRGSVSLLRHKSLHRI